jgi:two-component system cell cycle response regulator
LQGKILIVDAVATNRIVLKVKLKRAYYEVLQVASMKEAVQIARDDAPDLVIAALDLPDGGAADLSDTFSKHPKTEHIPIIATGCQPDTQTRMQTLAAGVRDVLDQPVNETLLLGRVRSLIRAHNAAAEWQMREDTCRALGLAEDAEEFEDQGHCVLVSADKVLLQRSVHALRTSLRARLTLTDAAGVMGEASRNPVPDVFVLLLPADRGAAVDELRVISTLRANAQARHLGIIVVQSFPDPNLGADALDLGADDLMTGGFVAAELALRTRAVIRRKRIGEKLRATVRTGLQAAVFDPLTGLYNRRYAMPHLARIAAIAQTSGKHFSVLAADIDHFKRINDTYGHAAGDAVLIEVAERLRNAVRKTDMVARTGGEEFVVIMPNTGMQEAQKASMRICNGISSTPFKIPGQQAAIRVTISIGTAVGCDHHFTLSDPEEIGSALLIEADRALYTAKGGGRNQVTLGRPAA